MNLVAKAPGKCSDEEIQAFCELVRKGDEVDPNGLEGRVRGARMLFFGSSNGSLIAVGGIKFPDEGYRAGVFRKSKSGLKAVDFGVELGWLMVDESVRRRGYGRQTMDEVVAAIDNERVYATSRATNEPMHALLGVYRFDQAGKPWRSIRGPYDLVLHVKQ